MASCSVLIRIALPHAKGLSYNNCPPPPFTVELGICKSTPLFSPFSVCVLAKERVMFAAALQTFSFSDFQDYIYGVLFYGFTQLSS